MAGVNAGNAQRPVLRALAQVVMAGCAGSLTLLLGFHMTVFAVFTFGFQGGLLAVAVLAGTGIGVLYGVASVAPEASWLTRSKGGRVSWAVLVGGLGVGGVGLGWEISDAAELELGRNAVIWLPLCAVPFALVAGLLLRRWYLAVGSLALTVVGAAALLAPLAATVPDRETDIRLAGQDRGELFVTHVPGYHVIPQMDLWRLEPDDPGDPLQARADRYVHVHVLKPSAARQCAASVNSGNLDCVEDRSDLSYWRLPDRHLYLHTRGAMDVEVIGGLGVDRGLLRDAALAARPATDDELLIMLRPVPERPGTFVDSVKRFAKQVFG